MNLLVDPTEAKKEGAISDDEILRLVRRAQEKEPEAFGDLFEMLEEKLHRHAYFLSGNEQQALDLVQETMIEAWKHLSRYDGRARFFTWICSIMVHRHYDLLRRLRVRATAILRQAHEAQQDSVEHSPAHFADNFERAQLLRSCLDQLPAKQRIVVYLRFYAGESIDGIAAIANCSAGTVKSRLFHGLQRLARMPRLKEFNLQPEVEK